VLLAGRVDRDSEGGVGWRGWVGWVYRGGRLRGGICSGR